MPVPVWFCRVIVASRDLTIFFLFQNRSPLTTGRIISFAASTPLNRPPFVRSEILSPTTMSSYYEPQGWQAPAATARQVSWEQPAPPSRSGRILVSSRT